MTACASRWGVQHDPAGYLREIDYITEFSREVIKKRYHSKRNYLRIPNSMRFWRSSTHTKRGSPIRLDPTRYSSSTNSATSGCLLRNSHSDPVEQRIIKPELKFEIRYVASSEFVLAHEAYGLRWEFFSAENVTDVHRPERNAGVAYRYALF